LAAAIGVPDTAATELSKPKMPWESSFGAKVQTAREEKKRVWQDSMRQLNEARKMNVEQLKKKVEVYVKLGRKIPEEQIKGGGKTCPKRRDHVKDLVRWSIVTL
jgi:hypothetical protein